MKISLPNTFKTKKGFTLVELLVVIAIIAILAVIAISVFSGAQANARDGRRRANIDSYSKALESSKDFTSGIYQYTSTDFTKDFPNAPATADPTICIAYAPALGTTPPNPLPSTSNPGACPSGGGAPAFSSINNFSSSVPANTKAWAICASLERGTPYCIKSLGGG